MSIFPHRPRALKSYMPGDDPCRRAGLQSLAQVLEHEGNRDATGCDTGMEVTICSGLATARSQGNATQVWYTFATGDPPAASGPINCFF